MLYVISQQNHPLLQYRGGQGPIVHLEADLHQVVQWARENNRFWAFSTIDAAHSAAAFYCALDRLNEINWSAVNAQSWMHCRDEKQAEFLVRESFPWHLIRRIGVHSHSMVQMARNAVGSATHRPNIEVRRDWYYS